MLESHVIERDTVTIKFSAKALTCELWCWSGDWHWKVTLPTQGDKSYLANGWRKAHWNGSRWQRISVEEIPGPVWDRMKRSLMDLDVARIAFQMQAIKHSAERLGIAP